MGKLDSSVAGAWRRFYADSPKPFPALLNWHVIYTAGPLPVEHRKVGLPQKVDDKWPACAVFATYSSYCEAGEVVTQGAVADQCRRIQFEAGTTSVSSSTG